MRKISFGAIFLSAFVVFSFGAVSIAQNNNGSGYRVSPVREEKTIENVKWDATVMQYTGNKNDTEDSRNKFRIYQLDEYTKELGSQHALNRSQENQLSKESLQRTTEAVIDAEFLK